MDVFELRDRLVEDYSAYVRSFVTICDERIRARVDADLDSGLLWPAPQIGLNPAFEPGGWVDELVANGTLHAECSRIFRASKAADDPDGRPMRLHRHQVEAIEAARQKANCVLTTGTGSGKSLAYIIPIVDSALPTPGPGMRAIVVYPMNALANSQLGELEKFLSFGYPGGRGPVSYARYTGQESEDDRKLIAQNPPDILLTNYVMLELLLSRDGDRQGDHDCRRGSAVPGPRRAAHLPGRESVALASTSADLASARNCRASEGT